MMHTRFFAVFLFFVVAGSYELSAQENKRSHQIKTYMIFGFRDIQSNVITDSSQSTEVTTTTGSSEQGRLSFSYSFNTQKGNVHEFELNRMQFWNRDDRTTLDNGFGEPTVVAGAKKRGAHIAVRYEYLHKLYQFGESHPATIYLGESTLCSFINASSRPYSSQSFQTSENTIGLAFGLVPRITFDLSDRLFIDINSPINVMSASLITEEVQNPSFTAEQQRTSVFDFEISNIFLVRAGLGVRL